MKCPACKQGVMKPGRVTVTVERSNTTIGIRGVPALVCETCGEEYFDADIAGRLDEVLSQAMQAGITLQVREYAA